MKIYKKHGSKEKLFEMMSRVNKIKLNESTDLDRYENVVFAQGEDADEPLRILNDQGEEAALEYLKQWHDYGNHEGTSQLGAGSSDDTFEKDGYIMSYNPRIGYIGLQYDLQQGQNESFDSPKSKDEEYLNKGGDKEDIDVQANKYDDGVREPRERGIQVKDDSVEKLKGDDKPIEEGGFMDAFNDTFPKTTSHRSQAMKGPSGFSAELQGQQIKKANEIKERYITVKRTVGMNQLAKSLANDYKNLTGYDIESEHTLDPNIQDGYMAEAGGDTCPHCNGSGKLGGEPLEFTNGMMPPENKMDRPEHQKPQKFDRNMIEKGKNPKLEIPKMGEGEEEEEVEIDVPEDGHEDAIEGGLADDKAPDEFDPKQISLGLEVEMEHTNDPREALEIAMDHLTEDPEYYGNGEEDPDAEAQEHAEDDAEEMEDEVMDSDSEEEAPEKIEDDDLSVNMNWLETIKPNKVEDMNEAFFRNLSYSDSKNNFVERFLPRAEAYAGTDGNKLLKTIMKIIEEKNRGNEPNWDSYDLENRWVNDTMEAYAEQGGYEDFDNETGDWNFQSGIEEGEKKKTLD